MPASSLEIEVRHRSGATIFDLCGEINAQAEMALNAAYGEAVAGNATVILFNFASVDYINSTGIALIVGLLARARSAKRRLIACGLSEHYVEIFALTRLVDYMTVYPDEASALAAVGAA